MAARLTDKQKKKIIADYVECGSYNAVAKKHGIAVTTVKRACEKDTETKQKAIQKKQENTAEILKHMEGKQRDVCEIIDLYLDRLKRIDMFIDLKPNQLTTALGTLIDKFAPSEKNSAGDASGPFEIPARLVAPAFMPVLLDILDKGHLEYVEEGGRGSTKSSFISLVIPTLIKNNPQMHAVCCRKVGNTLRDSVFAQICWAIDALGLGAEFDSKVSPLEITYKPTGQKIYFRGADDPIKLKSIKPQFGYIGILWYEELDQFAGPEEVRNIRQSAIRGGDTAWVFKSFNPPKTKSNWANQYVLEDNPGALVHSSTYNDVPPEWLG